ncbi:MFS transporter [Pseudonocardia ailaonensis]|uniref:MFS transporter n=1 Tax=Pseudonocardia ailaonensis TaxID=367279 RepID=A0ABN2MS00_9PSEU
MTHRQVVQALAGMLLAMFSAFLSATIVSNALPTIITDLHGSQNQYTWLVTATLLASTASTPIWGKLADLFSKKLLVQIGIVVYIGGSVLAGFSQSVETLIAWRALQGLGLGALQSLVIIVIAAVVSPRERGRYTGPMAAVVSVATIAGPLIGGLIVDSPLGWRWCFWVGAPVAVVAMVVVQRTLNLPVIRRKVRIDYLGAALLAAGVCDLLIWVTLAGDEFAWGSGTSWALLGTGVALLALAVLVESRAAEPIVPLYLFRERTTTLAVIASVAVGVAMFGGAIFLGQYFQIARGFSPTAAGLLTLPMIVASTVAATVSGQVITRTGRWKGFLVGGGALLTAGFGLLGTIDHATDMVLVEVYLGVLGLGIGMIMQNLVLAVQNTVRASDLGAASSAVTFFRSLGGTVGVSVLGAILATRVAELTTSGVADAGIGVVDDVGIGALNQLPPVLVEIVRGAYGDGSARIFLVAAGLSVITLLTTLCIREIPLRTLSGIEQQRAELAPALSSLSDAVHAQSVTSEQVVVGPAIYGFVTGASGGGIAGAVVTVTGANGEQVARAATQADGGYEFHLATGGTYLLVVASGALQPAAAMVPVAGVPVRHDVALDGGATVSGTVLGGPGGGVTVTLIDARGDVAGAATTDGAGRYLVPGIPEGSYTLTASAPGVPPVATSVLVGAGATTHDVTLADRAELRGTVRAGSTGGPVAEAVVTLAAGDGAVVASGRTDAAGKFGFAGLAAGSYTLAAAGYAPDVQVVRVQPGLDAQVRVVLGGTPSAPQRAGERSGTPVAGA